jgi:hypothetical protein
MAKDSGSKILTLGLVGVGGYFLWQMLTAKPTGTVAPAPPPGTSPTMNQAQIPTSVSTAPSSTPQISNTMQALAANMQQNLGVSSASADAWDVAFTRIMGQAIDAKFGFSFDQAYGSVVNGVRNNGAMMSALTFLMLAAQNVPGGLPGLSGLASALVRYPGPVLSTHGNMLFAAHHPLPYALTYTLRGLGAFTQPTGLERALFAGQPLNPMRAFGRRVMR